MKKIFTFIIIAFVFMVSACKSSSINQSVTSSLVEGSNELFLNLTLVDVADKAKSQVVFEIFDNEQFEGEPIASFTVPVDLTGEAGDVKKAYSFVALAEGTFYVQAFLDENSNGERDEGEMYGANEDSEDAPQPITIDAHSRKTINFSIE